MRYLIINSTWNDGYLQTIEDCSEHQSSFRFWNKKGRSTLENNGFQRWKRVKRNSARQRLFIYKEGVLHIIHKLTFSIDGCLTAFLLDSLFAWNTNCRSNFKQGCLLACYEYFAHLSLYCYWRRPLFQTWNWHLDSVSYWAAYSCNLELHVYVNRSFYP